MKKWCVYVCGKKKGGGGGGGGGGRTAYRVGNLIYIYIKFDFCFTSFETFFFLDFKKVSHNFQSFLCTKSRSQICKLHVLVIDN